MEVSADFGFTATEIHDPQKLCRRAEQLDLVPYRVEKDVRVNAVLQDMGLAPWPEDGCLLFAGGTGLAKAWRLSSRLSEDVDFWYLGRTLPPDISADTQQRIHAHLRHCLQQWVLSRIPGSSINDSLSQFREAVPVQRVFWKYPSVAEPGWSETLKVEVMLAKAVSHWLSRSVESFPAMTGETTALIPQYPCVATWATMLGKLHALSLVHPGRNHQDMRHVHDLGSWRAANDPSFHPS